MALPPAVAGAAAPLFCCQPGCRGIRSVSAARGRALPEGVGFGCIVLLPAA